MDNEELVAQIQAGEHDRMAELWEQVEKFVRWRADHWPTSAVVDHEDLYQAGYLALVRAVETYDPERGAKFITHFTNHLKTAFTEAHNQRSKKQLLDPIHHADSLSRPLNDEGVELLDTIADPHGLQEVEERIWHEELSCAIKKAIEALPEAESDTIRRRYYHGQTMDQVAWETGKTAYEVQKNERRGLAALRKPSAGLLAFIEERTPYYLHVGYSRFNTTHTSAVEELVFLRDKMERSCDNK